MGQLAPSLGARYARRPKRWFHFRSHHFWRPARLQCHVSSLDSSFTLTLVTGGDPNSQSSFTAEARDEGGRRGEIELRINLTHDGAGKGAEAPARAQTRSTSRRRPRPGTQVPNTSACAARPTTSAQAHASQRAPKLNEVEETSQRRRQPRGRRRKLGVVLRRHLSSDLRRQQLQLLGVERSLDVSE